MSAIVSLKNVYQHINKRCVLENISFTINPGDSFALLGDNGAGKTQLIRLIIGLDQPSSGKIVVMDQDITRLPKDKLFELRRSMGLIMQGGSLLNNLTVLENLILPLRGQNIGTEKMQRMATLIMTQLQLDGLENLRPGELSSGLMRKIELARALIYQPQLLIWDDPFHGLDYSTMLDVQSRLNTLRKLQNMTFIFSMHRIAETTPMANRIGVLESGRLLFTGTQQQLELAKSDDYELRYALQPGN